MSLSTNLKKNSLPPTETVLNDHTAVTSRFLGCQPAFKTPRGALIADNQIFCVLENNLNKR